MRPPEAEEVDDRRRQVAEADRLGDHPARGDPARLDDQERDVELLAIEAPAVADEPVLADPRRGRR